jgi:hypothetical protein
MNVIEFVQMFLPLTRIASLFVPVFRRACGRARAAFSLVATLSSVVLLITVALGLLSLSAIALRVPAGVEPMAMARSNARTALALAIGQLQRTLGPDQRVSAAAGLLGDDLRHPHWTGVWNTTLADGTQLIERDDLDGGLRDRRGQSAPQVAEWLVSGSTARATDGPRSALPGPVRVGRDESGLPVETSKVVLAGTDGTPRGHIGWWTGDLGVRANIATRDAWAGRADDPVAGRFARMVSQAAEPALIGDGPDLGDDARGRLASAATAGLAAGGGDWARLHSFDFTVESQGVLADVVRGGLKRDLTAFFESNGSVPAWRGVAGLADAEPIIGHLQDKAAAFRHGRASPRFGLLREWAALNAPADGRRVPARLAETDRSPRTAGISRALALSNEQPVKLEGNLKPHLQPVLVEATLFINYTTYEVARSNPKSWQFRQHLYPRVVLWNPYNVKLDFEQAVIMIQGNGRQDMKTTNADGSLTSWRMFEGGRVTPPGLQGPTSEVYNDQYIGSYYFSIPPTSFSPGECLVFSPERAAEYNSRTIYSGTSNENYNLLENRLSCEVPPDVRRSYFITGIILPPAGTTRRPVHYWFDADGHNAAALQADDCRALLKHAGGLTRVTYDDQRADSIDRLPQLSLLSGSFQYGAGREPRVAWAGSERMICQLLTEGQHPTVTPNVRMRESIRLRWFDEHPSNLLNSGALNGTPHFEDAIMANWNPRASFVLRSPWENIAGQGGPWFFGAYTRDLYDENTVGWNAQTPLAGGGRQRGNPFGPPQEGAGRYVLFDVPRRGTGVVSLGQLQHARLSDFIWHPSYAIGNSLADPRLGSGRGNRGLSRTAPIGDGVSGRFGGFHERQIGFPADAGRGPSNQWAATARAMLADTPASDNLVYDLSFEANHTLWDRYFLSTGDAAAKTAFAIDPTRNPLPNGRLRLVPGRAPAPADLGHFHRAASVMMVDGAFNVNSTRVEAWKALLGSTRGIGGTGPNTPLPRMPDAPGKRWQSGDSTDFTAIWDVRRELTPTEIDRLARAIVGEVRARGPFLSLADFVNRRLRDDETGRMGAIEAAIDKAGINASLARAHPLDNGRPLPDYRHPDHIPDATRLEQTLKPPSKAWGAPAWLTQADVLQVIGPALAPRSDTFVIRAYGDAVDAAGGMAAAAWCEAVLQRIPEPIIPDNSGINPRDGGSPRDFGRRFVVRSFRWLTETEAGMRDSS